MAILHALSTDLSNVHAAIVKAELCAKNCSAIMQRGFDNNCNRLTTVTY